MTSEELGLMLPLIQMAMEKINKEFGTQEMRNKPMWDEHK
jgi:hypothetical protein